MPLYELDGKRPQLGAAAFVAPGATLIGEVTLGEGASLWFGTVVRGDVFPVRIGARTNIQDGSVVHVTGGKWATMVGDDVTVGHMVLLHGCTVGDRCLVGMGSALLDEVVLGEECIVAAGSLLTPRTVVPPRSLVMGRPARVVRAVTEQDLGWIRESARHYAELAQRYGSLREVG